MSERKTINLDTFIPENMDVRDVVYLEDLYPELKKLLLTFGREILALACENAKIGNKPYDFNECNLIHEFDIYIDKQSILDTIKQVN